MLQFTFQNKLYRLEFERRKEEVFVHRKGKDGQDKTTKTQSKYPFTTARLLELKGTNTTPIIVSKAKVGCLPTDKYSHELGRQEALRLLCYNLHKIYPAPVGKAFCGAVWDTYVSRLAESTDTLKKRLIEAEKRVEVLKRRITAREAQHAGSGAETSASA